MQKTVRVFLGMFCLMWAGQNGAETVTPEQVVSQALEWMSGNPVMSRVDGTVASVSTFSGECAYFVIVVELSPTGYLILNPDDRLPLIVAFSADSNLDLSDDPNNALRTMLLDYCDRMDEQLSTMPVRAAAQGEIESGDDKLYGPFLETSWSQNDSYNLFCPGVSGGLSGYDNRAPVGCVPTAFAQVLNFHRWPVHGTGAHSYSDSSGSTTGSHSADFSDSYDWANMKASHSPFDSPPEQEAVGELMFELGVAAEANYESNGTSSSTYMLGNRLDDYFFFESINYHSSQSALIAPMEADLRAGFPCVVSIPGHAIVTDGLMVAGGSTTYHINYGWGGINNGWFSANAVPGGALSSGITSIRPVLMAFPESDAVTATNGSAELNWILPKRLENKISKMTIKQYVSGSWGTLAEDTTLTSRRFSATKTLWDDGDDFSVFEVTSTSTYRDWVVSTISGVDNCFYKEPGGYTNRRYHLTSRSTITPTAFTRLVLHGKYDAVFDESFRVMVSTDRVEFSEIWSVHGSTDWGDMVVDLSAYAGQALYIRLEYYYPSGSYTVGGGVWIDSISTQEVTNPELEGQPVYYTQLSGLSDGTYTLAAMLTDTNSVEHAIGPSFSLAVSGASNDSDGDGLPDWWETQYYGGITNAVTNVVAANGVNTVIESYIAGINPTNPSSFFTASLTNQNGFVVRWNAVSGRVYSVLGSTHVSDGFQPLATDILWPQSSWTDSVERTEQFYQIGVELE